MDYTGAARVCGSVPALQCGGPMGVSQCLKY